MVNFPTKNGVYLVKYKGEPIYIEEAFNITGKSYSYKIVKDISGKLLTPVIKVPHFCEFHNMDAGYTFEKLTELGQILYG